MQTSVLILIFKKHEDGIWRWNSFFKVLYIWLPEGPVSPQLRTTLQIQNSLIPSHYLLFSSHLSVLVKFPFKFVRIFAIKIIKFDLISIQPLTNHASCKQSPFANKIPQIYLTAVFINCQFMYMYAVRAMKQYDKRNWKLSTKTAANKFPSWSEMQSSGHMASKQPKPRMRTCTWHKN